MLQRSMAQSRSYAAFLFDMDGTLITSVAAAERVWSRWAERHGLDVDAFLTTIHGVRAADTIRRQNLADIDLDAEVAWVEQGEIEDVADVAPIPGAIEFVKRLPPDRWAVVTSATVPLARARLAAAGVEPPALMVTAEDVERGKPDPAGYLTAAEALGFDIADCLVFEDAEAGVRAGEAAGRTWSSSRRPGPIRSRPRTRSWRTTARRRWTSCPTGGCR